jgi:hypothetical protein
MGNVTHDLSSATVTTTATSMITTVENALLSTNVKNAVNTISKDLTAAFSSPNVTSASNTIAGDLGALVWSPNVTTFLTTVATYPATLTIENLITSSASGTVNAALSAGFNQLIQAIAGLPIGQNQAPASTGTDLIHQAEDFVSNVVENVVSTTNNLVNQIGNIFASIF